MKESLVLEGEKLIQDLRWCSSHYMECAEQSVLVQVESQLRMQLLKMNCLHLPLSNLLVLDGTLFRKAHQLVHHHPQVGHRDRVILPQEIHQMKLIRSVE